MITFDILLKLCAASGTPITLAQLLLKMADEDGNQEDEFSSYFVCTGLEKSQIREILLDSVNSSTSQENEFLDYIAIRNPGERKYGWHLLEALCEKREHPLTLALVARGLNVDILYKNLLRNKPANSSPIWQRNNLLSTSIMPLSLLGGRDLTVLAKQGEFNELFDQRQQSDQIIDILLKRNRGNVVLTGAEGVGKSTIVLLLARRIAQGQVPKMLADCKIIEISVASLVEGTTYRGQLEQRFKELASILSQQKNIILFIDELHLICGAGRAEGAPMDIANLMKPLLVQKRIRIIGATTTAEYHRYIACDKALARRFEEVPLEEPTGDVLQNIVLHQMEILSQHHGLLITPNLAYRAISLADRYLSQRRQPDKSINLLDTAAAFVAGQGKCKLEEGDLLDVLARTTKCRLAVMEENDRVHLQSLSTRIKRRICGQDQAIDKIVEVLQYRQQGFAPVDRNVGTFLFAGTSSVGKTETAINLAREFFGNEKVLLHIDCGEYTTADSVTKLLGASPGFVGYDQEGILGSFLHENGFGVLLFDEIEKAHEDIRRLLLGVLDNGRVTSAHGEKLNTRQFIVIVTTNALQSDELIRKSFGFSSTANAPDVCELLSRSFAPEFLARFDELVLFNSLDQSAIREIIELRLDDGVKRFANQGIMFIYNREMMVDWVERELDRNHCGARGILRILETKVFQPLASTVLAQGIGFRGHITLGDSFYTSGVVQVIKDTLGLAECHHGE